MVKYTSTRQETVISGIHYSPSYGKDITVVTLIHSCAVTDIVILTCSTNKKFRLYNKQISTFIGTHQSTVDWVKSYKTRSAVGGRLRYMWEKRVLSETCYLLCWLYPNFNSFLLRKQKTNYLALCFLYTNPNTWITLYFRKVLTWVK